MATIFLLFASPDREVALRARAELRAASVNVLSDEDIAYAQDYMEALNEALYSSDAVVALLSPSAFKVRLVTGVLEFALQIGKPILPLFAGSRMAVELALPEALSRLADTPWYEAADMPAWLSALLAEDSMAFAEDNERDRRRELAASETAPAAVLPPAPAPSIAPQPEPPPRPADPVAFTAYAPRETQPAVWQPLLAYLYRERAAPAVASDAADAFGDAAGEFRPVREAARTLVAEGALVTATPVLPGFQINPPSISLLFLDDWQRFDFRIRSAGAPSDLAANGRITFTVEGVIAADLPLSVFVTGSASAPALTPVTAAGVRPYQSVFCSYSHKDTAIVERVERAIRLLGFSYLRDATALRSGEDWNAALMSLIERADIFQLFWSSHAAASPYVRQEWEHALKVGAARPQFIRPVYWEDPMPAPPAPLAKLHFEFDPQLDDHITP